MKQHSKNIWWHATRCPVQPSFQHQEVVSTQLKSKTSGICFAVTTVEEAMFYAEQQCKERWLWVEMLVPSGPNRCWDIEGSHEVARWMKSQGRNVMLSYPLEIHTLIAVQLLGVQQVCIVPTSPTLGVVELQRTVIEWGLENLSFTFGIFVDDCVCEADQQWLRTQGWGPITS